VDDFTRAGDRNTKVSRQPIDTQHACSSGLTKRGHWYTASNLMRCASGSALCAGVGGFVARFSLAATMLEQGTRYKVALRQSEEGFSVSCPGLPGCWSQGATEQEALANIRDPRTHHP